ncbi:MAG TPA: response regulator transcription factor [Mycobacterium sp.]
MSKAIPSLSVREKTRGEPGSWDLLPGRLESRRDQLCHARILVVDDYALFRDHLVEALTTRAALVRVAWDNWSLSSALREGPLDLVLLNMATRDSESLLTVILQSSPSFKVIALGLSEDDESRIVACAESGVAGYHLRAESLEDLIHVIEKVADGHSACSPRIAPILMRRLSVLAGQRRPEPRELVLTAREAQILRMVEMGLSNRDIAAQLCIAVSTVKNHVRSLLAKLGVSSRGEAAALCRARHHTDPDQWTRQGLV